MIQTPRNPARPKTPTSGLTLIEILVSVAILSLLASAVLPSISRAMARMNEAHRPWASDDISSLADEFMHNPANVDTKRLDEFIHGQVLAIPFPKDSEGRPESTAAAVRMLRATDQDLEAEHAWLVFQGQKSSVFRWCKLPATVKKAPVRGGGP